MDKKEQKLAIELEEVKHKNAMEELTFELDGQIQVEKLKHNHGMERQRIKSAEIKRTIDQKRYN